MMIHYSRRPLSLGEKDLHHNLSAALQLLWHILSGGPTLQPRAAFSQMLLQSEIVLFPRSTHPLGSVRRLEHMSHKRRLKPEGVRLKLLEPSLWSRCRRHPGWFASSWELKRQWGSKIVSSMLASVSKHVNGEASDLMGGQISQDHPVNTHLQNPRQIQRLPLKQCFSNEKAIFTSF